MILKASQRGGAGQLAAHLLRVDDNEHVELHEVRGFISDDLTGALKEAQATAKGTRCKQFLFSVSLNPPESEHVKVETFENAIDRIEEQNGLTGQPRVVIFHEKEGRRHAHAVWSRIDAETMTARHLSHYKLKLRDISRELYLENDWQMPRGLMNSQARDPRNFSLAEWQQTKRMGQNARDLKALLQDCWAVSDSKEAFAMALRERGLILAKGDRRGHVAVTHDGEVLSVARYLGRKAKEVRAKLGEADSLPEIEEAKSQHTKDMRATFQRHVAEAREQKRRALEPLEERRTAMVRQHREERVRLEQKQRTRQDEEARARSARLHSGMKGLWQRITGNYTRTQKQNEREAYDALQRDRSQKEMLIFSQLSERRDLQAQIKGVRQRHAGLFREIRHERQALQKLRNQFQETSGRESEAQPRPKAEAPSRAANQAERLRALREAGPAKPLDRGKDREPER